jgi:hypothetical protein
MPRHACTWVGAWVDLGTRRRRKKEGRKEGRKGGRSVIVLLIVVFGHRTRADRFEGEQLGCHRPKMQKRIKPFLTLYVMKNEGCSRQEKPSLRNYMPCDPLGVRERGRKAEEDKKLLAMHGIKQRFDRMARERPSDMGHSQLRRCRCCISRLACRCDRLRKYCTRL